MAATGTLESVGVERQFLIRVIAELAAAAEIMAVLVDDGNRDEEVTNHYWGLSDDLRKHAFGKIDAVDAEFDAHPLIVETGAMSREIAADLLEKTFIPDVVDEL